MARDWKLEYADLAAYCNRVEAERDRLREAVTLAIKTIKGLADQQAMDDDWYEPALYILERAAALFPENQETETT